MYSPKWLLGSVSCVLVGLFLGWIWPQPTQLDFLSVGQGDCAVFRHQGTTILIDCGPKNPKIDAGAKIVVPKLRQLGVNGVDLILLSHPDMDHIGGTGSIIQAFPEATIAASRCFRTNKQLLTLLRKWGRSPNNVKWLGPELKGRIGSFDIRIDCPQTFPDEETNDGSMLVRLSDQNATAVFTGDAPAKVERAFAPVEDWRGEILKAGHHGSRTATSEEWLRAVQPTFAILSCGLHNEYHHPHREVVDRLNADGIKMCRTDQEGDILFEMHGDHFERVGR